VKSAKVRKAKTDLAEQGQRYMRLLKFLVVLILAALVALVAYAYLGDMAAPQQEMRVPVNTEGAGG